MKKKLSRFLRSELMGRWQVSPSQAAAMDVTRESIANFLQDTFEFSKLRAAVEADEFLRSFEEKLSRATTSANDEFPAETKSFKSAAAA